MPVSGANASGDAQQKFELPATGKNILRDGGGWFNLDFEGTRLVARFFDEKKRPMTPDAVRGFARFRYTAKNGVRAPLNPEGETRVTPAKIRLLHNFLVILSLFSGEAFEPAETYTLKYP